MLMTRDELVEVIRMPSLPKIKKRWAKPVLVGDFIAGLNKPMAFSVNGQVLAEMVRAALRHSPEFQRHGLTPQILANPLDLGEEEKSLELADPENLVNRIRSIGFALREADDADVKSLSEFVGQGMDLVKGGALDSKVSAAKLKVFFESATTQIETGPLSQFADQLRTTSPSVLLKDIQSFASVFSKAGTKPTRDAALAAVPAAEAQAISEAEDRAKGIRTTFETVADTFAAALVYCLHAGFDGEFVVIHVPRKMSQAKIAAFVIEELIERKDGCYDVVLLNPIADPTALTTHWGPYFSGEEMVQATIFASLAYKSLAELDEKAKQSYVQSGSAAAHFCVVAGYGTLLGRRTPIGPAVAGSRRKRDGLLHPPSGFFGLLESSFGSGEDKSIQGFENIDVLALRDTSRKNYAKNGLNTVGLTDGIVHLFRANSLSSDVEFAQYDATRAANWIIGTMRQYMRKVPIGKCNDKILKQGVATDVTELLNTPFSDKADFEVLVTPGISDDPREFHITVTLPSLAYVETVKIFVQLASPPKAKK